MALKERPVVERFSGRETLEGAGVRLRRQFGNAQVPLFDPFLLLDNFGSSNPADYLAGFPWHPHRGIETVTYMLSGNVVHEDSLGNAGKIDSGDVQWMSAGSGILHQEMPQRTEGRLSGFQLWVNLPAREKMSVPAYRGLTAEDFPIVSTGQSVQVKVVAGTYGGVEGPVRGIPIDPTYLDVTLPADTEFEHPIRPGYTAFAQVIDGTLQVGRGSASPETAQTTLLFGDGDVVRTRSGPQGVRFLLVSGRPLHEPVAWYGPIVMNRNEELTQALRELRSGDFVKHRTVQES